MYLDKYKIEGAINNDTNECFSKEETYPNFQENLNKFKEDLVSMVDNKENKSFFKFGDGDYFFLKAKSVGSAGVGKRAIGKSYSEINHKEFVNGAKLNDFYTCELYERNRKLFSEVLQNIKINYPAEYGYGLVANKWFFKTFKGRIGVIGADSKVEIIKNLMNQKEYQLKMEKL